MISDWRVKFAAPLPFFFVQLAAFPEGNNEYANIRWAQVAALALPQVAMASAIDLGDPQSPAGSIHPRNKQAVGARLSLAVRNVLYSEDIDWRGPTANGVSIVPLGASQFQLTLAFNNTLGSLVYRDPESCSKCCSGGQDPFEVLGSDSKWVLGSSAVGASTVTVKATLASGVKPVGVRYAWTDYPECILYDSQNSLPSTPWQAHF